MSSRNITKFGGSLVTRSRSPAPGAFTLVELLVVITIIGILAGLITAAALRARITAKNTAISVELKQLETALIAYKEKFGEFPPDFAFVDETIYTSCSSEIRNAARQAVLRHIRKAFPRCTTINNWGEFEAMASAAGITLTPQTALVFWLGGMRDSSTGKPIGFSANPANPFEIISTSRIPPFYDFDQNQLNTPVGYLYWPKEAIGNLATGQGAIAYFRAENGGYQIVDPTNTSNFLVKHAIDPSSVGTIYPAVDAGLGVAVPPWVNSKTVQIFSSGLDKTYGAFTAPLPFPTGPYPEQTFDDITNFSGGTLEDAMP